MTQAVFLYNKSNQFGLAEDVKVFEDILKQASREGNLAFNKVRISDPLEPPILCDIAFHFEVPIYAYFPWARKNCLIINQTELQTKAINYGYVIKSFESDIDTIDSEIKRLQGLKKVRDNAITRMKSALLEAMQVYGIEKVASPTLTLSIRNNPESVEVLNEIQVDRRYWNEKVIWSLDKVAVKKAIQSGEAVEGCVLMRTQSIQIK
jgi:hypothetical protein